MAYNPHNNRSYGYFNANDIMRMITDEIGELGEYTGAVIEKAADYGRRRLEDTSPAGTEKGREYKRYTYAKSWRVRKAFKKGYNSSGAGNGYKSNSTGYLYKLENAVGRVIYNSQGYLTHILEYGTKVRDTPYYRGKGTPRRHIENAFMDTLRYVEELID